MATETGSPADSRATHRKTKIVATVGPASREPAVLRELIEAGADVLRLNFAHAPPEEHAENVARIRNIPAVIVQGDRVAAAACFLPLTINPRLSKELGSRHRAAIGLTEENDSIAIVVSEETGIISVASDGQIERNLDASALRRRLHALILARQSNGQPQGAQST